MDHEKTLRLEVEADFAGLVDEVACMKINTINQVRF